MKYKKYIVGVGVLLLLLLYSTNAFAACEDETGNHLVHCWDAIENNATGVIDKIATIKNLTMFSDKQAGSVLKISNSTTGFEVYNNDTSEVSSRVMCFDGAKFAGTVTDPYAVNETSLEDNGSVCFWTLPIADFTGNNWHFMFEQYRPAFNRGADDYDHRAYAYDESSQTIQDIQGPSVKTERWIHVCLTWNVTRGNATAFVNGTYRKGTTGFNTGMSWDVGNYCWFVGGYMNSGSCGTTDPPFKGCIADLRVYDKELQPEEVHNIYHTGDTQNDGSAQPDDHSLNLTISYPAAGGFYNTTAQSDTFWINFTTNLTSGCTLNDSRFVINTVNASNTSFSFINYSIDDGYFSINVSCVNISANASEAINFTIDNIEPVIYTPFSSGTIFAVWDNNKVTNLSISLNVTDSNLYRVTVNDSVLGTIINATSIGATTYNTTISINVTNYTIGYNDITITVSDGHTANRIDEWDYDQNFLSKKITYDFRERIFENKYLAITPENIGMFDSFSTEKKFDRYTFEVDSSNKNELEFLVEASGRIDIIQDDSKYKGWLVIPSIGKWVDFNLVGATGSEVYNVERLSGTSVRVTVSNLPKRDVYVFESTGDLNIESVTYSWLLVNITENYPTTSYENSSSSYSINITKSSSNITTNASFYYNHTYYTPSKIETSTFDYYNVSPLHDAIGVGYNFSVAINWTVNISSSTIDYSNRTNTTDTIYAFIIRDCGATVATPTQNFTVRDLVSLEFVKGYTFEAIYNVWIDANTDYKKSFGFNNATRNDSNQVCMYPDSATLNYDLEAEFSQSLYETAYYYIVNEDLNSTVQTVNIYLINDSSTTKRTIVLVDENDQELRDYKIEAWKYNTATDDYTFITSELTGSTGKADFYLDLSYQYRFIVRNPSNDIVYTEPKQKLIESEYTFRIVLGTTPEAINLKLDELDITLTSSRLGRNFSVVWNDIDWTTYVLNFTVIGGNSTNDDYVIYHVFSTNNSGVLTYNLSSTVQNTTSTYTARVWVGMLDDLQFHLIAMESLNFQEAWEIFGDTESLIMAFFLVGTLIFIGAAISVTASLLLAIAALIGSWYIGMYVVSASAVMSIILVLLILLFKARDQFG